MSLKSVLKDSCVHACSKMTSVEQIVNLMKENDVGSIVVTEDDKPVGIITDRDLVLRAMSKGADGLRLSAEELMTSPIETVGENAGIFDVIEKMKEKGIRRLCITDSTGKCTNLVSFGDILELWAQEVGKLAEGTVPCGEKLVKKAC